MKVVLKLRNHKETNKEKENYNCGCRRDEKIDYHG
jgi:hypothetical protein